MYRIFHVLLLGRNLYCYHVFKPTNNDLARVSRSDRACAVQCSALSISVVVVGGVMLTSLKVASVV
jgi:hypothetical protein